MLKDITLGQYFPGKTVVHRLDPRTKLLMTVLYIVALFVAQGWIAYGIVFAFLVMSIALSRIRPKAVLRGLKPVVIVVIFTAVLNLFYTGGEHVLVRFWGLTITWEGIQAALFMGTRIIMLITGTFLLTYTTSPIALTDGLESLLNPLKKIRLPVHELTMIMCIALRFIPTLIEETDKIMSAQKARGGKKNLSRKFGRKMPGKIPRTFAPKSRQCGKGKNTYAPKIRLPKSAATSTKISLNFRSFPSRIFLRHFDCFRGGRRTGVVSRGYGKGVSSAIPL